YLLSKGGIKVAAATSLKQINYIHTMLEQASFKTREDFSRSGTELSKLTSRTIISRWVNRLETELGFK
ncbi:hypothetical protein, partial [Paenibacillus alba]